MQQQGVGVVLGNPGVCPKAWPGLQLGSQSTIRYTSFERDGNGPVVSCAISPEVALRDRKSLHNNGLYQAYEPARLSTPHKPLFSLKPLDSNLVEVIVI